MLHWVQVRWYRFVERLGRRTLDTGARGDWESETNSDGVSSGSGRPNCHLPYRDSKLTRIMQPSLSGNSLIVVVCTISPTVRCAEESHNTLKFAQRAKKIKMTARVNEVIDDKTLLRAYRAEIELLRAKLEAALEENGIFFITILFFDRNSFQKLVFFSNKYKFLIGIPIKNYFFLFKKTIF